jgi:hypothetical protein
MASTRQNNTWWFWGEGWSRFGAFSLLGGIVIFFAHILFPQARWAIAVFAVLLMAAFGYWEWRYKVGQEDRLGDDLYYLGLTYTLVSVVHALYAFTGAANAERLVSDFSVALLSTLVGIVGRVLLYEKGASQRTPADVDEGIAHLRAEIEGAICQMQEFRRSLALNVQQTSDSAVQGITTSFASVASSAKQMSEAANAISAALRKGAGAVDESVGRIGRVLGEAPAQLAEGTKALGSISEALSRQMGAVSSSLGQQGEVLTATLDAQKETARRLRADLESLRGSMSMLARSIGEMREQIDGAKEDFSSAQLEMTIAEARDAAERLGRNLRFVADTVAVAGRDLSVLKAFAVALSELTSKIDDCTRKLGGLDLEPLKTVVRQQFVRASDGSAAPGPGGRAGGDPAGAEAVGDPRHAGEGKGTADGSSTIDAIAPHTRSIPVDYVAEKRDSVGEARSRAWWRWRRD